MFQASVSRIGGGVLLSSASSITDGLLNQSYDTLAWEPSLLGSQNEWLADRMKNWKTFPITWAFASLLSLVALRCICIVVYRLYFHPLARFPGPKMAAISRLYEFWYQGIKRTEFPQKIKEMHQMYGPIVRISPFELSLNDSDFNLEYFLKDRKLDKDPWYYGLGFTESLFTLLDKDKHRQRQTHLSSHFSGTRFADATPIVSRELQALLSAFRASAESLKPLNLSLVYRKMSNEILRIFLLGERGDATKSEDYSKEAEIAYHPIFKTMTFVRHFPILYQIHAIIPNWVYSRWLPLAKYQRDAEDHIRLLVDENDKQGGKDNALLYHFVDQDPSYRINQATAAVEEFTALQWGGREVLGHGLTNISYHLMANPSYMEKLHEALLTSGIDIATASYNDLQKIPYLRAVCQEGLRMQLGGGFRIPRTNKEPVQYKEWVIPAETPISMCPKFFHDDEEHFPDHLTFKPERWLQSDVEELNRYFKPFGNGSRSCIGMNLALEVVYRVISNVYSQYKTEFSGIDAEFCQQDGMLKVFPHKESHGLTVSVSET